MYNKQQNMSNNNKNKTSKIIENEFLWKYDE